MRLFLFFTLLTTVIAAPIYQPAFHGPLPGKEHEFQLHHVKHVDEQGKVTYIHDTSDHRPDFCSIPGEEELCRQQIEAANNAPAVFDDGDDTIILTEPHRDDELAPGHNSLTHATNPLDATTTITLDDGNVITVPNSHQRNVNDGGVNIDGPPAEGGHVPNIRPQQGQSQQGQTRSEQQQARQENIQEDDVIPDLIVVPHQRNVNDNPQQDGPAEGGHVPNINKGQAVAEKISSEQPSDAPQSPFPGAFGPHTIASHPINKLQEAIRKTTIQQ